MADTIKALAVKVKKAAPQVALLSTQTKNRALEAMAAAVLANQPAILRANAKDMAAAKSHGIKGALLSRLILDEKKLNSIASTLITIAGLPDPVGRVISENTRPNGLKIRKVGVPLGVILIIYESRPNVTADCMALCLKSGNAVILKGGSEALHSNTALFHILEKAALKAGVPKGAFDLIKTSGRAAVGTLLTLSSQIDLVIPRGGEGLIRDVAKNSKIPVIKHYKGVCHVYIDKDADLGKASKIVINAKTQNPGVCNAMETLLVHKDSASLFLPGLLGTLKAKGVEVRGDQKTRAYGKKVKKASEKDWGAEYLDLILAARVVNSLEEAMEHIAKYGSSHSDAIVTENKAAADKFVRTIDSACVFVNASTRFNDGGEFGMGAEMGISTDKLHARGPMGLEELTSYKYIVTGDGQVRG